MWRCVILSVVFFISSFSKAQTVGLVLSGGGAKGATHIGVIKCLEENGIPIDYIAGTSIGAVIGCLYSMGYTTEEMEEMITSREFQQWQTGKIDEKSIFYFRRPLPTSEMFTMTMKLTDSLMFKPNILPRSLLKPTQMNIVFLQLCAQANAACNSDFDKLMVPFRCVASDVNNKRAAVLRKGDLGDAVRASMSFPMLFLPVEIDGKTLYDGGIFNNFPVDVMRKEFNPDYIIGVSVGDEQKDTDSESNVIEQLEGMIINRSGDFESDSSTTILDFNYRGVGLLDFNRTHELVQIGYDSVQKNIVSLKSKIKRSVSQSEVDSKRINFREKLPELRFRNISFDNGTPAQKKFLKRNILSKKDSLITYEKFRRSYFNLLSDPKVKELQTHSVYDTVDSIFDLKLKLKINDNMRFGLGGNLSSSYVNELYARVDYQNLTIIPFSISLDGQIGHFYKGASFNSRLEFQTEIPFSAVFSGVAHNFSYYNNNTINYSLNSKDYSYAENEDYVKLKLLTPCFRTGKIGVSYGYGKINYRYNSALNVDGEHDGINHVLSVVSFVYDKNSYTVRQFPTAGSMLKLCANYAAGKSYENNSLYAEDSTIYRFNSGRKNVSWLQLSLTANNYYKISKHFVLGSFFEGLYSTFDFKENVKEAVIIMPAFQPTLHSKTICNPYFRSDAYLSIGLIPIVKLNNQFHLRFENYLYAPLSYFDFYSTNNKVLDEKYNRMSLISEIDAVFQLDRFTLSAYGNFYSPNKSFNAGINFGFMLFNQKLVEK